MCFLALWAESVLLRPAGQHLVSRFRAGLHRNLDGWVFLRCFNFPPVFGLFINLNSKQLRCTKVKVFLCGWDFLPCSDQPTPTSTIDYVSSFLRLVRCIEILLFLSTGDVQLVAGRRWWRLCRACVRDWKVGRNESVIFWRTFAKKMQKIESIVSVSSLTLL